jgi:hypothetical protein
VSKEEKGRQSSAKRETSTYEYSPSRHMGLDAGLMRASGHNRVESNQAGFKYRYNTGIWLHIQVVGYTR